MKNGLLKGKLTKGWLYKKPVVETVFPPKLGWQLGFWMAGFSFNELGLGDRQDEPGVRQDFSGVRQDYPGVRQD